MDDGRIIERKGGHQEENPPTLLPTLPTFSPVKQPPYPKDLMLKHELETLGLFLSLHPPESVTALYPGRPGGGGFRFHITDGELDRISG